MHMVTKCAVLAVLLGVVLCNPVPETETVTKGMGMGMGGMGGMGMGEGSDSSDDSESDSEPIRCMGNRDYVLELRFNFNAVDHPLYYPEGGVQTPAIIVSHNANYVPWTPHTIASEGIATVAETGDVSVLQGEADAQIALNNAGQHNTWPNGPVPNNGPDAQQTVPITLTPGYPYATFINMIAPSNDWFVGGYNVNLCQDGEWVDYYGGYLNPWDAGSESIDPDAAEGATPFTFDGVDTVPPEPIRLIECDEAFNECAKGMGMGMGMGMGRGTGITPIGYWVIKAADVDMMVGPDMVKSN